MLRSSISNSKNRFGPYILFLLLLPLIFFLLGAFLPVQYDNTYLGELNHKLDRIERTPGKRIIVIGGSNVPFSLIGEIIDEEFDDYSFVDFGLYLNLGTTTMYDLAEDHIQNGDIIIISPEQAASALSMNYSPQDLLEAVDGNFSSITKLSSDKIKKTIAAWPEFSLQKTKYFFTGKPNPTDIYQLSSFNTYGDIGATRPYNIMPQQKDTNTTIFFDSGIISADFINYTNEFARRSVAKGAKVYYHFSPMNRNALAAEANETTVKEYYEYLDSQLLFPILGNPNDCIMDGEWFYDTNFHLNDSGALLYTKVFIDDLKTALGITTVTAIETPTYPTIPVIHFQGDDSHENHFIYTETPDGLIISELKKDNLPENLTLPTFHNGLPIVDYEKDIFNGCNELKTVTFQKNLRLVYDGLFQDCNNFAGIILDSSTPSDFSVGDNLFAERTFKLYVPKDAIGKYKTDYTFKKYNKHIFVNE